MRFPRIGRPRYEVASATRRRRGISFGAASAKPASSSTGEERIEIGAAVLGAVLIAGALRFGWRRRPSR